MIIRKGDFIRKEKSIYLIKSYKEIDSRHVIEYYFKATKQPNAQLHRNGIQKIYPHQFRRIKEATREEINSLLNKIKEEEPEFSLKSYNQNTRNLDQIEKEKNCVEFLKQRGYIIYKKI